MNEDWKEEYGGQFELWDVDMKACRTSILPLFNRMGMFSTTSTSYHGNPNVVRCPEGRSRKSLALYYYTNGRPVEEMSVSEADHNTLFKYRKEDKKSRFLNTVKETIRLVTPPILLHGFNKAKS